MCHKPVPFTSWTTWSCACAFKFNVAPLCWCLPPMTDIPRRWSPPKKKTTVKTHVSSARQANPIGHVYKILLPSQSRLCMFRRSLRHVQSHSWTHSDAWPIFCHHIKQTTILADLGVDWWACGPYNCYCLLLLSGTMRMFLIVSWDGWSQWRWCQRVGESTLNKGERWEVV